MLANELARQKPEVVEEFSRDFVKDGWFRSGPVAVDHLQAIEAETKATLEEFVAKVVARQAGMREELSRDL